jgi:regulatory protein
MLSSPTDIERALNRARRYCAYQERCVKDVTDKLRGWKVSPGEAKKLIGQLKEEGFLDEERYARLYVRGHFRNKYWGKTRITYELKSKGISEEIIHTALEEIGEEEYMNALKELLMKKNSEIDDSHALRKKQKLVSFAVRKGFEYSLVMEMAGKLGL